MRRAQGEGASEQDADHSDADEGLDANDYHILEPIPLKARPIVVEYKLGDDLFPWSGYGGKHYEPARNLACRERQCRASYQFSPEDNMLRPQRNSDPTHGEEEISGTLQFVDAESEVLVVGAYVSLIAIPLSRHCPELYAIEPNPATFDLLNSNIAVNRVTNVNAASAHDEETEFLANRPKSRGLEANAESESDHLLSGSPANSLRACATA